VTAAWERPSTPRDLVREPAVLSPMPLPHGCLNGRIMKCLTFFLLLPETLKKSKKSVRSNGKAPGCSEAVPLALKKKMAAELYPANTNIANSNAAAAGSKKPALQLQQSAQPPPPPQLQNLNNNNLESASWQSCHPTLRER